MCIILKNKVYGKDLEIFSIKFKKILNFLLNDILNFKIVIFENVFLVIFLVMLID